MSPLTVGVGPADLIDAAIDLPTIDLTGTTTPAAAARGTVDLDPLAYDERYAQLGFGLGVAPRKLRRDDPWWETPAGMLGLLAGFLMLVWFFAAAH
ncbi:MAG: hypothetical protein ACXVJF_01665 [Acidimicrobiia bacterium]